MVEGKAWYRSTFIAHWKLTSQFDLTDLNDVGPCPCSYACSCPFLSPLISVKKCDKRKRKRRRRRRRRRERSKGKNRRGRSSKSTGSTTSRSMKWRARARVRAEEEESAVWTCFYSFPFLCPYPEGRTRGVVCASSEMQMGRATTRAVRVSGQTTLPPPPPLRRR